MEKMTCPICSKKFDVEYMDYLENGNVVCRDCAAKEDKRREMQDDHDKEK